MLIVGRSDSKPGSIVINNFENENANGTVAYI